MKAKIPFQPGLALGSIINPSVLNKIENCSNIANRIESGLQQLSIAKQKIDEALREIDIITKQGYNDAASLARKSVLEHQISFFSLFAETYNNELISQMQSVKHPGLENFQSGLSSPIDINNSNIIVTKRSFDSFDFSSKYINMEKNSGDYNNTMKSFSTSNSVSATIGYSFFGGTAGFGLNAAVSKRLTEIKETNQAEGVLVINATVSSRNVKSFGEIRYDLHTLRTIYSLMKSDNIEKWGIANIDGLGKAIYVLDEAILGASFVGLVTFSKKEENNAKSKKNLKNIDASGGIKGDANIKGLKLGNADISSSNNYSSGSSADSFNTLSNTLINVEIMAQGAIPSFSREVVVSEIAKKYNLNPSNIIEIDPSEQDHWNGDASFVSQKHRFKVESAQKKELNQNHEIYYNKTSHSVYNIESVVTAYDNFINTIIGDQEAGVPIGFNYRILTEAEITKILGNES